MLRRNRLPIHLNLILAAGSLCLFARPLFATNGSWINPVTGGLWGTSTNWTGGSIASGIDAIADFSTLDITANNTVHLDATRAVGQIIFGDLTPSNSWVLDNNATPANVINLATSSGNATITVSNQSATISAIITGAPSLAKAGPGSLTLSGANTYTGTTIISSGTLILGSATALGTTTAGTTVGTSATLDLGGQAIGIEPLSLQGIGVGGIGALINSSGSAASITGPVTLIAAATVGGSGDITLSGTVIQNTLTKIGNNTLTLSGAADNGNLSLAVTSGGVILAKTSTTAIHAVNASGLTISGGTVQLAGAGGDQIQDQANVTFTGGTLDFNGRSETFAALQGSGSIITNNAAATTSTMTFNSTVNGTLYSGILRDGLGILAVTKSGLASQIFSGVNSYSGPTTVSQGALIVGGAGAIPTTSPVIVAASGTVDLNGFDATIGSLSGAGTVISSGDGLTTNLTVGADNSSTTFSGVLSNSLTGRPLALNKIGSGTLTLSGINTTTGNIQILGGTLALSGGSLAGASITNNATFVYNSGAIVGYFINRGTLTLNADFSALAGLENDASLLIPTSRIITVGAPGLLNQGNLVLNGGTLILPTSINASNINNGSFILSPNNPFNLNGATLTNNGTLDLNSGTAVGTGLLTNAPAGTLSGDGAILSPFSNSGLLFVSTATTNISLPWTNSGQTYLSAITSNLTGAAITNTGTIQGLGSVGSNIINNGSIEPIGGTLRLGGNVTQNSAATIRVSTGNKLLITSGLAINAGTISLTGGTFDNNNAPLLNNGQISGFGTFATGGAGLTNAGSITFTGGLTTINGNVTNNATQNINIKFNPAIFTGNVINNGNIKTTSTTATFAGNFTNNASFISDPSINIFQSNITNGPAALMTGSTGDVFNFSGGTFTNQGAFDNGGTLQSSNPTINSGNFTQSGPQTWSSNTTFTNTGTANFNSDSGSPSSSPLAIIVSAGNVNFGSTQHLASLTVNAGKVSVLAGTTRTNALTLAGNTGNWTGALDLTTHKLIIQAAANHAAAVILAKDQIAYGRTHTAGIFSSTLDADHSLITIDNAIANLTTFGGQPVDANSILALAALNGDANLDGQVTIADLNTLAAHWQQSVSNWTQGDFNNDGLVTIADLNTIAAHWQAGVGIGTGNSLSFSEAVAFAFSTPRSVPEPSAAALLGFGLLPLLLRLNRKV